MHGKPNDWKQRVVVTRRILHPPSTIKNGSLSVLEVTRYISNTLRNIITFVVTK